MPSKKSANPKPRQPRIRVKRRTGQDPVQQHLGTLPERIPLTTSDEAEKWLKARLVLLLPVDGVKPSLGAGIIAISLTDARPFLEALKTLVRDDILDISLLHGALRIEIRYERLLDLARWARGVEAIPAKKRSERKEARAARPDGLDRTHDAERLDEWLAPEPERAVQMSLFGGRS